MPSILQQAERSLEAFDLRYWHDSHAPGVASILHLRTHLLIAMSTPAVATGTTLSLDLDPLPAIDKHLEAHLPGRLIEYALRLARDAGALSLEPLLLQEGTPPFTALEFWVHHLWLERQTQAKLYRPDAFKRDQFIRLSYDLHPLHQICERWEHNASLNDPQRATLLLVAQRLMRRAFFLSPLAERKSLRLIVGITNRMPSSELAHEFLRPFDRRLTELRATYQPRI